MTLNDPERRILLFFTDNSESGKTAASTENDNLAQSTTQVN